MSLRWFKLKAAPKSLTTTEEDDRLVFNYILSKWEPDKKIPKESNLKSKFLQFMCDKIGRGTIANDKCSAATSGFNKIQAYIAAQKATYERLKATAKGKYDKMWGEMKAMHAKVVKDDKVAPKQGQGDGYSSM